MKTPPKNNPHSSGGEKEKGITSRRIEAFILDSADPWQQENRERVMQEFKQFITLKKI